MLWYRSSDFLFCTCTCLIQLLMQKIKLLILLLFCLLSFICLVNWLNPKTENTFNPEKCTRYCHSVNCQHSQGGKGMKDWSLFAQSMGKLYFSNIRLLKNNGLGLSYQEMNLLIYVIIYPTLVLLLSWNLLPKSRKQKTKYE